MTMLENIQWDLKSIIDRRGNRSKDLWHSRAEEKISKALGGSQESILNALLNFRRNQLFISELPTIDPNSVLARYTAHGRAHLRWCDERIDLLERSKMTDLLLKYPISKTGNPYYYRSGQFEYNERWTRHIRYLGLTIKHLGAELESGGVVVDVGGAYGIYLGLLRQEFPKCQYIIIDLAEQLLTTYYYLKVEYPDIRVNTLASAYGAENIDMDFIGKFDVVLLPSDCIAGLSDIPVKLLTNFLSFGEMNPDSYESYSALRRSAEYFFTVNRARSRPTYDNDTDISSYDLFDYEMRHFELSPLYSHYYSGRGGLFVKKKYFTSPVFEFIGSKLKDGSQKNYSDPSRRSHS